jgi:hypothetical protein
MLRNRVLIFQGKCHAFPQSTGGGIERAKLFGVCGLHRAFESPPPAGSGQSHICCGTHLYLPLAPNSLTPVEHPTPLGSPALTQGFLLSHICTLPNTHFMLPLPDTITSLSTQEAVLLCGFDL